MKTKVLYKDLGLLAYDKALAIQVHHFEMIKSIKIQNRDQNQSRKTPNFFFFVTHPPVYTLGKNGNIHNILLSETELMQKGVSFYKTNRGGDVTYHGPGQIVGYPVLDLDNFFGDIHQYMRQLEEVIIRSLAEYGIPGERSEGETGVWIDVGSSKARKICALGVHTSRWVTMHGFALNVNTDLQFFKGIIPCGIRDKAVTSMQEELGRTVDENHVKTSIKKHFEAVFSASFTPYAG